MLISTLLLSLDADERNFIEKLLLDYGDMMYSTAIGILKNKHDAEDAVYDTFYKISRHIDKFDPHRKDKNKELNKIIIGLKASIRNLSITNYNKRKNRITNETSLYYDVDGQEFEIDIPSYEPDTEDLIIKQEEMQLVRHALLSLSPKLKEALNLIYYEGFTSAEAADFLSISDSAVRDRIHEAKKKLKAILQEEFI